MAINTFFPAGPAYFGVRDDVVYNSTVAYHIADNDSLPNVAEAEFDFRAARALQLIPDAAFREHSPLKVVRRIGLWYEEQPGRSLTCRWELDKLMLAVTSGRKITRFLSELSDYYDRPGVERDGENAVTSAEAWEVISRG